KPCCGTRNKRSSLERIDSCHRSSLGFRYRQAEGAAMAAVDAFQRATFVSRSATWFRRTHVSNEGQSTAPRPSQKIRLFYERWSIKFSAEYYEAKEREASPLTGRKA